MSATPASGDASGLNAAVERLDALDELGVEQRADVLEDVNQALVDELAAMEEV